MSRAARLLDERRRELIASREKLNATSEALVGDDIVDVLRTRLAELRDAEPGEPGLWDAGDPTAARAELDAAVAAHKQAMADCETHRKVAEAAAKRLGERTTRANVTREKLTRGADRTDRRTREVDRAAVDGDRRRARGQGGGRR